MKKLVKVRLHGDLAEQFGHEWNLNVRSVGETLHAININTSRRFYKYLYTKDGGKTPYQIIVNGELIDPKIDENSTIEDVRQSELCVKRSNIETIDIIPIIAGSGKDIFASILGALLIVVGVILAFIPPLMPLGIGIAMAGAGLLAAGVISMLSKPPHFDDFREISNQGKNSYLYNGAVNITQEGGPVPIGYGRLLIGSQVVSAAFKTEDVKQMLPSPIPNSKELKNDVKWTPEGIFYPDTPKYDEADGHNFMTQRWISLTKVKIIDMLCEGEIEGIVDSDIKAYGSKGNLGFFPTSTRWVKYPDPEGEPGKGWLRSVYWNGVPVVGTVPSENAQQNSPSTKPKFNFQQVNLDLDSVKGAANGYAQVNPNNPNDHPDELLVSKTIGERLRGGAENEKIYRILNRDCIAIIVCIKVTQLYDQNYAQGTNYDNHLNYTIQVRPLLKDKTSPNWFVGVLNDAGSFNIAFYEDKIEGKITQGYVRSNRISLEKYSGLLADPSFLGWEIRIQRTDEESLSTFNKAIAYVDSLTEVYQSAFTYPRCAIVRCEFSSEFFGALPERAYDCRLLKVKVPNIYNPLSRSYNNGDQNPVWDGTFADRIQWTDNPAWCFYDLLTNRRYGLGRYIEEENIDKWAIFEIAKYCDILVDNGEGGLEPRFSCNVYLSNREQAYKVINDFASIFNGMLYYCGGVIQTVQDSPKDPIVLFTNANVKDGIFQYASSSRKVRNTIAIVRYNDPTNQFKPAIEYVEDLEGIRKYGIREVDLTAFGCTSKGQAIRLARWALISENQETETITFTAGLEACYLRPGDVFKVFDSNKKLKRHAGRVIQISDTTVTLDSKINLDSAVSYKLTIVTPSYNYNNSVIGLNSSNTTDFRKSFLQTKTFTGSDTSVNGDGYTQITISTPFDSTQYSLDGQLVWTVELATESDTYTAVSEFIDSNYDYFRVVKVREMEDFQFEVGGLQYYANKFSEIENGLTAHFNPVADFGEKPSSPNSIDLSADARVEKSNVVHYSFTFPDHKGITGYHLFVSKVKFTNSIPNNCFELNLALGSEKGEFETEGSGEYFFRVYGYNDNNDEGAKYSDDFAESSIVVQTKQGILTVSLTRLTTNSFDEPGTSITVNPNGGINFETDVISPTLSWQAGSTVSTVIPFSERITIREPSLTNIPSPVIYHEEYLMSGKYLGQYTFDFIKNSNLTGGPYRKYDVVVEQVDRNGNSSAGNAVYPSMVPWEGGWIDHQNGYEIFHVDHKPMSGLYLTTGVNTGQFGQYTTQQYIDTSNCVNINFSGTGYPLTYGLMGAIIYISDQQFTTGDIRTGALWIKPNEISMVYGQKAIRSFDTIGERILTGYTAVGFYDKFDYYRRLNDPSYDLTTGIYLTNIVPVTRRMTANDGLMLGYLEFADKHNTNVGFKLDLRKGSGYYAMTVQTTGLTNQNVVVASEV